MSHEKITVRGIETDAWDEIRAIHEATGVPYGRLVSEALWHWLDDLPQEDPIPIIRPVAAA